MMNRRARSLIVVCSLLAGACSELELERPPALIEFQFDGEAKRQRLAPDDGFVTFDKGTSEERHWLYASELEIYLPSLNKGTYGGSEVEVSWESKSSKNCSPIVASAKVIEGSSDPGSLVRGEFSSTVCGRNSDAPAPVKVTGRFVAERN
jgi:hypothetical protein